MNKIEYDDCYIGPLIKYYSNERKVEITGGNNSNPNGDNVTNTYIGELTVNQLEALELGLNIRRYLITGETE